MLKNSSTINQIIIRRTMKNTSFYLPLNSSLIGNLYLNLWNNFSKEIDNNYNFTMALEWYLHALTLEQIDMKFVSATTALECILAKFFTTNESQYKTTTLSSEEFKIFKNKIKPMIENTLVDLGKDQTKDEISIK